MFLFFIILLIASLTGLAGHIFNTLTLQAHTVVAVQTLFQYEQYSQGVLSYAVAKLASDMELQKEIVQKKRVNIICSLWNDSKNGYVEGGIIYRLAQSGYYIEINISCQGNFCGGLHAHIIKDEAAQKNTFSCVAIETF